MLTADLVRARPVDGQLRLTALTKPARERALAIGGDYLALARELRGEQRETFDARLADREVSPRDRRLADGLAKLVRDRCRFEMAAEADPVALRRAVFLEASQRRRSAPVSEDFQPELVAAEVGAGFDLEPEQVYEALYADLKGAHRLVSFEDLSPEALLDLYERGQVQAVLLKATRLRVWLPKRAGTTAAFRGLFRKLKFLRLLHSIRRVQGDEEGRAPEAGPGYLLEIDGPYSLFGSVTKYGLQLALLVPALDAFGAWRLEADLVWGHDKRLLSFAAEGPLGRSDAPPKRRRSEPLPEDAEHLVEAFRRLDTPWKVRRAADLLDLPGVGLSVPDLVFTDEVSGDRVFLELMGFWSRDAVWKRIELVEAGLPARILFAVSERLRVSEAVLDPEAPGALYVFKGVMNARRVLEKLEGLRGGP